MPAHGPSSRELRRLILPDWTSHRPFLDAPIGRTRPGPSPRLAQFMYLANQSSIWLGSFATHRLHQGQIVTLGHEHRQANETRHGAQQPILEVVRSIRASALLEGHGQARRLSCRPYRSLEVGSKRVESVDIRGRIVDPILQRGGAAPDYDDGRTPLEGEIDGPQESFDLSSDVVPHAATGTCFRKAVAKLSSSMFMRKPQRRARAGDLSCAAARANDPRPAEKNGRNAVRRRSRRRLARRTRRRSPPSWPVNSR